LPNVSTIIDKSFNFLFLISFGISFAIVYTNLLKVFGIWFGMVYKDRLYLTVGCSFAILFGTEDEEKEEEEEEDRFAMSWLLGRKERNHKTSMTSYKRA